MENETERFWTYLSEKGKKYLEKREINKSYEEFRKLWKQKYNFDNIFDNLRKREKIIFLIDKIWNILTEEESSTIKKNKSMYSHIFFQNLFNHLKQKGINAYFGLGSAEYFKDDFWQTPHTFHIINNKYNMEKKVENQTIIFIKFPKEIFIENAVLRVNSLEWRPFSDREKTLLDKIYYTEYLNGKTNLFISNNLDSERINMYLSFYKKYPLVKAKLITLLNEDQLKEIR